MLKSGVDNSEICSRACKDTALSESGCKLLDLVQDPHKICMRVLHNDNNNDLDILLMER